MRLSRESWIIFAIGIADLWTTLLWVQTHGAREANPVFAHYLAMGPAVFALMKLIMLAAPIFLLEWARRQRPVFTRRAARFAIAAYVSLYVVGVIQLNGRHLAAKADLHSVAISDLPGGSGDALARR